MRDFQSAVTSDTAAFGVFFRAMLERGIYLPPSQFEAWFISGAHTPRDIERTVAAAREAMIEVREARRRCAGLKPGALRSMAELAARASRRLVSVPGCDRVTAD